MDTHYQRRSDCLDMLSSSRAKAREAGAWVLGYIGNQSSVPALQKLLDDTDPLVRQTAAWSLKCLTTNSPRLTVDG